MGNYAIGKWFKRIFVGALLWVGMSSQQVAAQSIAGTYSGTYEGNDSGTVNIVIDANFNVVCDFFSTSTQTHTILNGVVTIASIYGIACTDISVGWEAAGNNLNTGGEAIQGSWTHTSISAAGAVSQTGSFITHLSSSSTSGASLSTNPSSVTGLWYDPKYSGSGFNLQMSSVGLLITYYGWDATGSRLWLTSDIGPTSITSGAAITLNMSENTGGTFNNPQHNVVKWGTLTLNFSNCHIATATLSGNDGTQSLNLSQLAGVVGLPSC